MTTEGLSKEKALLWAAQFENCCYLDSNGYTDSYGSYQTLIAAGTNQVLNTAAGKGFSDLKSFYDTHRTWMFGLLGYDLKNEVELLKSNQPDELNFPDLFFFIPEYILGITNDAVEVILGDTEILEQIGKLVIDEQKRDGTVLRIEQKLEKEQYLNAIDQIRSHISRGDIYEVTFCQEFFAKNAHIDPVHTFHHLSKISPTPFSGFMKIGESYILSASPERFLCKRGNTLISQPIKGTARRGQDPAEDELIRRKLSSDQKEQAENVMIVDLVRNDLTKSAVAGSVQVAELFGIYSFTQVHQMISTITCELRPDLHFIDAIKNTFPMGSMTGAPKIRAMEIIDEFEQSRRGAFSGALGYITPEGDFDFNVIIRSILYNASNNYVSFQVGGAITFASDPLKEYEECMLKASALMETLKGPR